MFLLCSVYHVQFPIPTVLSALGRRVAFHLDCCLMFVCLADASPCIPRTSVA